MSKGLDKDKDKDKDKEKPRDYTRFTREDGKVVIARSVSDVAIPEIATPFRLAMTKKNLVIICGICG